MLLERALITPDQLREALVERARNLSGGDGPSMPLGGILVRKGFLTDSQLNGLMAEQGQDAPAAFARPPVTPPPTVAIPAAQVTPPPTPPRPAYVTTTPRPSSGGILQSGPALPAVDADN